MAEEITVAIIAAIATVAGAVGAAIASYLFTKNKERQAELMQAKMERYNDLVRCLTRLVQDIADVDGQKRI
jgi:hypothetical protein